MEKVMKKIGLLAFILFINVFSKVVIFDFGGVLATKNKWTAASKLNLDLSLFNLGKLFTAQTKFYEYLSLLDSSDLAKEIQSSNLFCDDDNGKKVPPIMVDWFAGSITSEQIEEKFKQLDFKKSDKEIMLKIIKSLSPEILSQIMELNNSMFDLVKYCKDCGHRVIILSNFDDLTFKEFIKMYPEKFNLFDAIYVSGALKQVKPCKNIFNTILNQEKVESKDCIFIDDSDKNIVIANKLGFKTVHHKSVSNTKKVVKNYLNK